MPLWWATVMMFRRSNTAQYIFDSMNMIRANWRHYKDLYHIAGSLYRNDYALSIAVHELNQETSKNIAVAPYSQMVIPPWCTYTLDDTLTVLSTTADKPLQILNLAGVDFHALNKNNLLEVL